MRPFNVYKVYTDVHKFRRNHGNKCAENEIIIIIQLSKDTMMLYNVTVKQPWCYLNNMHMVLNNSLAQKA